MKRFASRINRHRLHRARKRVQSQSTIETLYEPSIRNDIAFHFSPYEVTRRYLEREAAPPLQGIAWRPFFDWPGQRCLELPMMAVQRRHPARFWELRIPKLPWPIEFLLPMTRLAFPTANLVDNLGVGDTVKLTKIIESGVVNVYLVGARGLRPIPEVDKISGYGLDEKGGGGVCGGTTAMGSMVGGSGAIGSIIWGAEDQGYSLGSNTSKLVTTSPGTRAASLVALHWAAKTLTLQPSPQIEFSYGTEKKSSCVCQLFTYPPSSISYFPLNGRPFLIHNWVMNLLPRSN